MLDYLPMHIANAILNLGIDDVYEIRLRADKPIMINRLNSYSPLIIIGNTQYADMKMIENIVLKVASFSMYTITDYLSQGFITTANGERIGVCGEIVYENGKVSHIKTITSLNIRIPHHVKNCHEKIFNIAYKKAIKNLLIISPPACGKTTVIRSLIKALSNKYMINILCIDERNELSANGRFDLGNTTDVLKYASKEFGFLNGVKTMRPDLIATDELSSVGDANAVIRAIYSGVAVLASIHSENLDSVKNSQPFHYLIESKVFDYYAVLDKNFSLYKMLDKEYLKVNYD